MKLRRSFTALLLATSVTVVSIVGTSPARADDSLAASGRNDGRSETGRTEATGGKTAGPWVLAGFGAAVAATGVGLYVVGTNRVTRGEARVIPANDPAPAVTQKVSDITAGRSMQTVGAVSGALGIAGVAGGLIWHFSEPKERQVRVTPSAGYGYGGLAVSGRF